MANMGFNILKSFVNSISLFIDYADIVRMQKQTYFGDNFRTQYYCKGVMFSTSQLIYCCDGSSVLESVWQKEEILLKQLWLHMFLLE